MVFMHKPVMDAEADVLLGGLEAERGLGLAVSGGADSMALMHLVARWRLRLAAAPPKVQVLTVDHRLRPGSTEDARFVCDAAAGLALEAHTLTWQGPKPVSGVQASARKERYRLLAAHAEQSGLTALVTAHTADDQAETLLMRLARGSGLDGLAAMPPRARHGGCDIVRPLLAVPRARLVATLQALGAAWIEDPSNRDHRFERVRLRALRRTLEAANLRTSVLARSARRLNRAREAVEAAVDAAMAAHVDSHPAGFCTIAAHALLGLPSEIALRMTARVLAAVGGRDEPVRLARLETLLERFCSGSFRGGTLGRCLLQSAGGRLLFLREIERTALPEIELEPGGRALWDGRFHVALAAAAPSAVTVRALSAAEVQRLETDHDPPAGIPAAALRAIPAFWRRPILIAVPNLGLGLQPEARDCEAAFRLPRAGERP